MVGMFALMLLVVGLTIFLRYVFNYSLFWSDELSRYLFIWVTLIGAALGVEKGMHFRVDFFVENYFPNRIKKVVSFVGSSLVAIFIICFFYYSIMLCVMASGEQSAALRISCGVIYSGMSISAFLMLVHLGLKMLLLYYESKKVA